MKSKIFILLIIVNWLSVIVIAKPNIKATFVIDNQKCNTCCISAIKILSKSFLEDDLSFNFSQIEVFVNKKNKIIKHLLSKDTDLDTNLFKILILGDDTLKKINKFDNDNCLILSDSLNNLYYYFINFTNTTEIVNTIKTYYLNKEVRITNEDISIGNILSPTILNNKLIFIEPDSDLTWEIDINNNQINQLPEPTKSIKFSFFDSTKNDIAIWEMTYDNYKSFIKNYFIFSSYNEIYSFISILSEYELKIVSSRKEAIWQNRLALMKLKQDEKVIPIKQPIHSEWISTKYTRLFSKVNDTIYIVPFYDETGNEYFRFFNTKKLEFLPNKITEFDILPCKIDSILFVSDGNNNIIFYDFNQNKLARFRFSMNELKKDKNLLDIKHSVNSEVYDIIANEDNLYFLYYRLNNGSYLYLEEFKIEREIKFNRSFICNSNQEYLENNIPVGFSNSFLYVLSKNADSEWIIEKFKILE